ncbi:MAG: dienelactone hydrolase family protein [Treponema sp.]|nr:dienelactone hydrolase family protein [Treponema sp.]
MKNPNPPETKQVSLNISLLAVIICIAAICIFSGYGFAAAAVFGVFVLVFLLNLLLRGIGSIAGKKIYAGKRKQIGRRIAVVCSVLLMVLSVFTAVCVFVFSVQDRILFRDVNDQMSREYLRNMPGYNEVEFTSAGGRTWHGMMYAPGEKKSPLVIYFGGNGECSYSNMVSRMRQNQWQFFAGYNYLFIDYEGYGINGGKTNYLKMYEQALAVYDYAANLPNIDNKRIVTMGFSLGTGCAVFLAANRPVTGLILSAPYSNGYDIFNNQLPVFYGPMKLLVKQKLPSQNFAPRVNCPVLIIASKSDEMVPFYSSQSLSKLFPGHVEFMELDHYSHNNLFKAPAVLEHIQSFLLEAGQAEAGQN